MHIRYSLTPADFKEYRRAYFSRLGGFWDRKHFPIFISFGIVVTIAGLNWVFYLHRDTYYGFVCVVLGLYLIWRGLWLRYWSWKRRYKKLRGYEDLEGEISRDGLTFRTKVEESNLKWEYYSGFAETETLFLLMTPQNSWAILPKRAFAPAEIDTFRGWARSKLEPARSAH